MITTRLPYRHIDGYLRLTGSINEPFLKQALPLCWDQLPGAVDLKIILAPGLISIVDLTTSTDSLTAAREWVDARSNAASNSLSDPPHGLSLLKLGITEYWVITTGADESLEQPALLDFYEILGNTYRHLISEQHSDTYLLGSGAKDVDTSPLNRNYSEEALNAQRPAALAELNSNNVPINHSDDMATHSLTLLPHQQVLLKEIQALFNVSLDVVAWATTLIYAKKLDLRSVVETAPLNGDSTRHVPGTPDHLSISTPGKRIQQLIDELAQYGQFDPSSAFQPRQILSETVPGKLISPTHGTSQDRPVPKLNFGPLVTASFLPLEINRTIQFPVACWFQQHDNGELALQVRVDESQADPVTTKLVARRLLFVAEQLHPALRTTVDEIEIIPADELNLIAGFSQSRVDYPRSSNIVILFEKQVAEHPTAPAVIFEREGLDYTELNERANQLAHFLLEKGLAHQSLVPICMERSAEMIIAILAVLKAGGAYVPIDPGYPTERIKYILEDTQATILLTNVDLPGLAGAEQIEILHVKNESKAIGKCPANDPGKLIRPTDLVYVLYTSGSTGRPKGVMIEHRALLDHCFGVINAASLDQCRSFALFSPLVFDAGHSLIHSAFILGAALHVLSTRLLADGQALKAYFETNSIDCLKIVPSLWLAYAGENQVVLAKKVMIFGGEAFPAELQSRLACYDGMVFNHYGPTEATIGKTIHRVDLTAAQGQISIGRPFSNTTIHIVDHQFNIQPINVPGELLIAGEGLARGYLNQAKLTSENFLPDLFTGGPQAKMYRTGDIAKWLPNGEIAYLGRADEQVKIRGHRIEIGEIEAVVRQSELVAQAAVTVRTAPTGELQLVGMFVPGSTFSLFELKSYLAGQLPAYMIPLRWIQLDRLPLTVNGKLDRKLLGEMPLPAFEREEQELPATALEKQLAVIWSKLLRVEEVDRNDNFFASGGHSLVAMRLVSSVRKTLGLHLELQVIFAHPTLAGLAAFLERSPAVDVEHKVQPSDESSPVLLSFGQQSLWFIDQATGSSDYHLPFVWNIKGNINKAELNTAFQLIIGRHLPLRTVISEHNGLGVPVFLAAEDWNLSCQDWSTLPRETGLATARLKHLVDHPFDLSQDFMLRATIIQQASDEYILLVTIHHIASDGWSTMLLVRELSETYYAIKSNRDPKLVGLPINYPDFARWQHSLTSLPTWEPSLDYWRRQLNEVPILQLPADFRSTAGAGNKGGIVEYDLTLELSKQLQELSQQQGATMFITLLAAFNVLLFRYTSQEDICVGTPIAGRQQEELEHLIGYFVNTLALRTRLHSGLSFDELLQQVKTTTLDAYRHQEVPFEQVVQLVAQERTDGVSPLFQSMLVLQNTPDLHHLELEGLEVCSGISRAQLHTNSKFPLTFILTQTPRGLNLTAEYQAAYFREETIARMVANYARLLEAIVTNPYQSISAFPVVSYGEENQLLQTFNLPATYGNNRFTILDLIQVQVIKQGSRAAVIFENQVLSYRELDERSNQLAHYLVKQGVQHTLVPICVERSFELVIGILAILKAGGAYVPIDPSYSPERIAFILADCVAPCLLVTSKTISSLEPGSTAQLISIDSDWPLIEHEPVTVNPTSPGTESLAYVIYTSGSTGKPKGTLLQHKSLLASIQTRIEYYSPLGRVLLVPSIAFDSSVAVLFGALASGDSLVLCPDEALKEARHLQQLLPHVDALLCVPSYYRFLLEEGLVANSALSTIILGGEQVDENLVAAHYAQKQSARLYNEYGPTEAAVWATVSELKADTPLVTIGKPIATTAVYILNSVSALVPLGVNGEICIGGVQVAQGYLNLPELTAEKFIPDPFAGIPGGRMYRTGDVGRWLPDGNIEFIGRNDEQVKIRGYRIELSGIERALLEFPSIAQAVVVVRETAAGDKRLVAYIVPNNAFDSEAVIEVLLGRLPGYMVPTAWITLDKFPLNVNGKIDRNNLPEPKISSPAQTGFVAPRNKLETSLVDTWKKLLGVERLSIHDNFFSSGGHSLLAMRMASGIRKEMKLDISVKQVFANPTVAKLAAALAVQTTGGIRPSMIRGSRPSKLPLSFSQESLWFIDRAAGSTQYHIPAVLKLRGKLDVAALASAFRSLINRHEILRTVIRDENGEGFQYIRENPTWEITTINDGSLATDPARLLKFLRQQHELPFNLAADCMLRATLVQLEADEHVLLITVHHIASDGWSVSLIEEGLLAFYNAAVSGLPPGLKPLSLQYADFALWQRDTFREAALGQHLSYWKDKLAGVTPLQLPLDYPRPLVQSSKGAMVDFQLDTELADRLQALANENGATLFMVLQTVLGVLLHRYSGQEDVCIGIPVAGRDQEEVEELVGFFVNTLALRSHVTGSDRFLELLEQVKATTLEAYDHQHVPFEMVVNATVTQRDPGRSPLFQVMLALQQQPAAPGFNLGEVRVSRWNEGLTGHSTAKFDLTFNVTQHQSGLACALEYCTDLFREETIRALLQHFERLLRSVVDNPTEKIGLLPMLSDLEFRRLVNKFGGKRSAFPSDKTIGDLFSEKVRIAPSDTALVFGEERLTYLQLNRRANQLANYLQKMGVKAGDMVPIFMERSIDLVVGCLGILKAGAVYVPVDPKYPAERISFMLEDVGGKLVLAIGESWKSFPADYAASVVLLDKEGDIIANESTDDPTTQVVANSHAYVMYTSGSTGKPKGVLVTHRNVVSLVKGVDYVSLGPGNILLSTGSASFDATTFEYWGMLLNGGQLILCADRLLLDTGLLKKEIRSRKVNMMWFTSSWFNQLADTDPGIFEPLRTILVGGEKLSVAHIEKVSVAHPHLEIINGYGPTENTTFSLTYAIRQHIAVPGIPIGRPLNNRTVYILDKYLQPVPVGVSGEIFVGGAGLATGYLNLPALTAEKFIAHPFSEVEGERLYRTGDIGRWLPGGDITFIGRNDEQVKIRGYRVEVGEIEHVLKQSDLVVDAVIKTMQDYSGSQQLVAYVVPGESFTREQLLAFLRSKLPEYFIPAVWVPMKALPLTANGKVDYKALPLPDKIAAPGKTQVQPRNEIEKTLAFIWQQLLNIERPGVHDNFFESGGHSLGAIRLAALIRNLMNIDVSINELFIFPTIAGLATHLNAKNDYSSPVVTDRCLVPLRTRGSKPPLYIMAGGGGTALRFKPFAELLGEEQPVYVLQSPMNVKSLEQFPKTIEGMAERFITEILEQNPVGPYALSGHCIGGLIAFEMAKRLELAGRKVQLLAMFDSILVQPKDETKGLWANILNIPSRVSELIHKFFFKLQFEFFLLSKHTKHALNYKRHSLKSLIEKNRRRFSGAAAPTPEGLEIMNAAADIYLAAKEHYALTPYTGKLVAFYAKERYFFTDADKKIRFRRMHLEEQVKQAWGPYAAAVTLHETEGDHSNMFDSLHGNQLAGLVQQYLASPPGENMPGLPVDREVFNHQAPVLLS